MISSSAHSAAPNTIIVTAEPALFEAALQRRFGDSVTVFAGKSQALDALSTRPWRLMFCDARGASGTLGDRANRWSGFALVRQLRAQGIPDGAAMYFMAQDVSGDRKWAVAHGADGLVARSPTAVTEIIRQSAEFRGVPVSPAALDLSDVDGALGLILGAASASHLDTVRRALEQGHIARNRTAYADALARSVTPSELRDALLRGLALAPVRRGGSA